MTAGANQAFMNIAITVLDAGDTVVLFAPYYFNHQMALQMTGCAASAELAQQEVFEILRNALESASDTSELSEVCPSPMFKTFWDALKGAQDTSGRFEAC